MVHCYKMLVSVCCVTEFAFAVLTLVVGNLTVFKGFLRHVWKDPLGAICVLPTVNYLQYLATGSTLTAVGPIQLPAP